jgi:hypothetical protein
MNIFLKWLHLNCKNISLKPIFKYFCKTKNTKMSHHQTEETTPTKVNYLLRIAMGFIYALVLAFLLHLLVGTQRCEHCTNCTACNECNESQLTKVKNATPWGENESGECCKGKDKCRKAHECKEEEKEESSKEEKHEEAEKK